MVHGFYICVEVSCSQRRMVVEDGSPFRFHLPRFSGHGSPVYDSLCRGKPLSEELYADLRNRNWLGNLRPVIVGSNLRNPRFGLTSHKIHRAVLDDSRIFRRHNSGLADRRCPLQRRRELAVGRPEHNAADAWVRLLPCNRTSSLLFASETSSTAFAS